MWLALVVTLASAPVEHGRYALILRDVPVGVVELKLEPSTGRYVYRSEHFFTRGTHRTSRAQTVELRLDSQRRVSGLVPESLWLWRRPSEGCVEGREEIGSRTGQLCATEVTDTRVRGTMFGESFDATYDAGGTLATLKLGHSRFVKLEGNVATPPDLFEEGFAVEGNEGVLTLVPAVRVKPVAPKSSWNSADAQQLAREVHESFTSKAPGAADFDASGGGEEGSCLAHARRFLHRAGKRDAAIIYGLVLDEGRAFPHAWVRVKLERGGWLDLDPTSMAPVETRTHLALGNGEAAGRLYLELLSGERRITRQR
jgi:hypothetical protein